MSLTRAFGKLLSSTSFAPANPLVTEPDSPVRAFMRELLTPVHLLQSAGQRLMAEHPRLTAAMKRTDWLTSPAGLHEYLPCVWFDGDNHFQAVVLVRGCQPGSDSKVSVYSRCDETFDTSRAARRAAITAATDAAMMKPVSRH